MTRTQTAAAAAVGALLAVLVLLGLVTGAVGHRIGIDLTSGAHLPDADPPGTAPGERDDTSAPTGPQDAPDPEVFDHGDGAPGIFTGAPGECLVDPSDTRVVPCDHPHRAEIYYTFTLEGDEYPGEDGMDTDLCLEMFGAYVGTTPEASGYGLTWLVPSESSWSEAGDREVICLLTTEEPATGSAYRSAQLIA